MKLIRTLKAIGAGDSLDIEVKLVRKRSAETKALDSDVQRYRGMTTRKTMSVMYLKPCGCYGEDQQHRQLRNRVLRQTR